MLGVVWPSLRETFAVPQSGLGAILIAGSTGYFLASFNADRLVGRFGIGNLLAFSSLLMTVSLAGFALTPLWWLFLGFAVLSGLGSGAVDAGMNTYAAEHFSARHMNWLHACWGFGAMTGPIIMTAILTSGWSWRWSYVLVGACLGAMTLCFFFTLRLWNRNGQHPDKPKTTPLPVATVLREPLVWLHILLFFFYTGVEAGAGQWSYTLFTEARGVDTLTAGLWTAIYWGSLAFGRIFFGIFVDRIGAGRLLRYCLFAATIGALLLYWRISDTLSFAGLALIGFSLAPVFPCLMARTPARLGSERAAHAIGFQVSAAMIGVAAIPGLLGIIGEAFGLEFIGLSLWLLSMLLFVLHEWLLRRAGP
jgi:fucose permease